MSSKVKRLLPAFFSVLIPVFFVSCIGASSNITINSNGGGTVTQEYRISLDLQDMGKTEETEDKLPVPMGKEDLERTVERVDGLRLLSFSSRQDDKDMFIKAEFAFDSPEALMELMSQGDQQIEFDLQGKKITLHFPAGEKSDDAFADVIIAAFLGYDFALSFTLPEKAKASWLDGNGQNVQKYPGTFSVNDRTVDFSVSMSDLMCLENALDLVISW